MTTQHARQALISVYDKEGIVEFAQGLINLGFHILSSGGTAEKLSRAGLPVIDVAAVSGQRAVLDHRVVTLVPQLHGGLLALPKHLEELRLLGWPWIDLVCVDLYPLADAIKADGATRDSVFEKTDIGGPTMLRSGFKGERIVVADPVDRARVLEWLQNGEPNADAFKRELGAKAEGIVAAYCLMSARFQSGGVIDGVIGTLAHQCKYGENAWQTPAGLYKVSDDDPLALHRYRLIAGTEPSFNNWCDIDRLSQTLTHIVAGFLVNFDAMPAVAIGVKHGNPCGVGVDGNPMRAIQKMTEGNPLALHGGLVMTNFALDEQEADGLLRWPEGQRRILDGVIAPEFTQQAVDVLERKGGKCRMLVNPSLTVLSRKSLDRANRIRYVRGGFLVQPNYTYVLDLHDPSVVFELEHGWARQDMVLAWAIGSTSNSNTITLVKDCKLLGNGVGQQDRVGAAELAIHRANRRSHDLSDAIAYSDSFFPFPDGLHVLADAGIKVILSSSGSINDESVRGAARERGVSLVLVPDAMARGFFGH